MGERQKRSWRAVAVATALVVCAVETSHADPSDESADHSTGVEGDEAALPAAPAAAAAGPKESGASLVAEADRELRAMRTSAYEHHTAIDESTGSFLYDCSGFVDYALRNAAPTAFAELTRATVRRPLARHLEGFFASIPPGTTRGHWMRVGKVSDLRPGDIIAWLQPADSSSKNTGHTLVVHGPLRPDDTAPGAFVVPVVDSTALKHGAQDSRAASDGTGLGTGSLVLLGDASGAPHAFRWSTGRRSRVRETAITLGRIVGG
jgi:hypothetical protein